MIKLPLVPGVETPVILVRAETGTGKGLPVREAVTIVPRLTASKLPHHDTTAVREMLDDILTRTMRQLDGIVQRRVVDLAHELDKFLDDTLLIYN